MSKKLNSSDARQEIPIADLSRFREALSALASGARESIQRHVAQGLNIRRKADGSFVTDADVETEKWMREFVRRSFPDHGLIGEEAEAERPEAPFQWIFDPIDGTEEFINNIPTYGSIIGLHYKGFPVVSLIDHPALDLCLTASFGQGARRNGNPVTIGKTPDPNQLRIALAARKNFFGAADEGQLFDQITQAFPNHRIYRSCYAHVLAAMGAIDAMIEYGNHVWDLAATQLLIEEAGGRYEIVQDVHTDDGDHILGAVFGRAEAVQQIIETIFRRS